MSHSGHGGHGGGAKIPENYELAQIYWIFAGGTIVIAGFVNFAEKLIYRQRLSAALKASEIDPARPKHFLTRLWATITQLTREVIYFHPSPIFHKYPQLNLPPLGRILLVAANISLLLSIAFWAFNLKNNRQWEDIAVRCGWMTIAQLPLIFLMAGKRNIVGFITGSSYERLNWIHRWVARCLFITATVHFAYFFKTWGRYNYIETKLDDDLISRRGLGAWGVLLWITVSSFAPIRNLRYEFFVVQHAISYIAFITMLVLHTPKKAHVWIWVPTGLFFFDKLVRSLYLLYNNISLFHRTRTTASATRSLFTCKATFTALPDRATKITIPNPPFTWSPGQHVFLSCHSILPLQSHPFTIASLPSDNEITFVVRAHRGGTHRLFRHAKTCLPPLECKSAMIDGPYGRMRPLEQFDGVTLIAGSTGATFTIPLLRDLVRRARLRKEANGEREGLVTRRVKFIWVVKNRGQIEWFMKELKDVFETLRSSYKEKDPEGAGPDFEVEASIYITCDDTLTKDHKILGSEDSSQTTSNSEIASSPSSGSEKPTVREKENGVQTEARETQPANAMCGGDRCCCQDTILDEDAILPEGQTQTTNICRCGLPASPPSPSAPASNPPQPLTAITDNISPLSPSTRTSSTSLSPPTSPDPISPSSEIHLFSGRPAVRILINKELEKARGESAVVVCGPKGLVGIVRESVVALSDERAACKGSGAQGIWLHCEAFGW